MRRSDEAHRLSQNEDRLESYVAGIVGAFAEDERVLAFDLWNEPDNARIPSSGAPAFLWRSVETNNLVPLASVVLLSTSRCTGCPRKQLS